MNFSPGVFGGAVATLLVGWLASRAVPTAKFRNGRFIVEYGLAARVVTWFFLGGGLFAAYAALRASEDQRLLAACVGGTMLLCTVLMFLHFQFFRVEFDENQIYTFSSWRRRRVIPWAAVKAYSQRSHVVKTHSHGSIHLSRMMSGLGTLYHRCQNALDSKAGAETVV
jgi:hypothetical protein